MLRVWGRLSSVNVQKVMWTIAELGLAHEHIPAGGDFGGLDDPEFLAMNPHGRVPVIDDGGTVVWESNAIVRYLAARYGEGCLCPADAAGRARCDQWMDWAATGFQGYFMDVFWGYYRTPAAQRNMAEVNLRWRATHQALRVADRVLAERPWLAGEAFSMADIPAGTLLYRYFGLDLERRPRPHVAAWYERLQARPAYRAEVMRPFDDLFGKLAF